MNPLSWLFVKGAASAAKVAVSKIPLKARPKTKEVRFADVPIGRRFRYGNDDDYIKRSHDEASPTEPDWMCTTRFGFYNPDRMVSLYLE